MTFHGPPSSKTTTGGTRLVELIVNGYPVASSAVPADGKLHSLEFTVPITQSSWVALRHFPQLHTNPINVFVGGNPIRASSKSARWCRETIKQLWRSRHSQIIPAERVEAAQTFDWAKKQYEQIENEARAVGN